MIPDSIHVAFMHLRVDRLRASLFKDGCQHVQLQIRGCERRLEETGGPCLSMWTHIILLHHSVAEFLGTLPFFFEDFYIAEDSAIAGMVDITHLQCRSYLSFSGAVSGLTVLLIQILEHEATISSRSLPKGLGQEPANGNTQCCRNNGTIQKPVVSSRLRMVPCHWMRLERRVQ